MRNFIFLVQVISGRLKKIISLTIKRDVSFNSNFKIQTHALNNNIFYLIFLYLKKVILNFFNFSRGHDGYDVFLKKVIYPLMSKGKFLGEYEKGQIDAYFLIEINIKQIGTILDRSKTAIRNYLASKNLIKSINKKVLSFRTIKKFKIWVRIKP